MLSKSEQIDTCPNCRMPVLEDEDWVYDPGRNRYFHVACPFRGGQGRSAAEVADCGRAGVLLVIATVVATLAALLFKLLGG